MTQRVDETSPLRLPAEPAPLDGRRGIIQLLNCKDYKRFSFEHEMRLLMSEVIKEMRTPGPLPTTGARQRLNVKMSGSCGGLIPQNSQHFSSIGRRFTLLALFVDNILI